MQGIKLDLHASCKLSGKVIKGHHLYQCIILGGAITVNLGKDVHGKLPCLVTLLPDEYDHVFYSSSLSALLIWFLAALQCPSIIFNLFQLPSSQLAVQDNNCEGALGLPQTAVRSLRAWNYAVVCKHELYSRTYV